MHEAGHLRYTKKLPENLVKDQLSHGILNCIEDVRIDIKNFYTLPNIREFYARGMEFEKEKRKTMDVSKIPLHKKVLANAIYRLEGFPDLCFKDKEVRDFEHKHQVQERMDDGVRYLDSGRWKPAKEMIAKIMQAFGFDKLPKMPIGGAGGGEGKGKGQTACPNCQGTGKTKGKEANTGVVHLLPENHVTAALPDKAFLY